MPTTSGLTPGSSRTISNRECRHWLASHREGRLGYTSGRGPRSLVVSYTLTGDDLVLRLPDYNDAVHYAPGAEVRLEVDGAVEVEVLGRATLGDDPADGDVELAETWPPGVATALLRIPLTKVRGHTHS